MFNSIDSFTNWEYIRQRLGQLAQKKLEAEQIVKAIAEFKYCSLLMRQHTAEKHVSAHFPALLTEYKKQLKDIYAKVAKFLLERPRMDIPLIKSGDSKEYTLTKQKILYLFCTMMLCLIPRQQFDTTLEARSRYNYVMDFSYIFEDEPYKTITALQYIKSQIDNVQSYQDTFVIKREVEDRKIEDIIQEHKQDPMCRLTMAPDNASIQDYYGCLKADFANKFLGGGALTYGCVQEEIMFANHPQLFTAQLLCEVMEPNEAIYLMGFKKYSKNSGYGHTTAYAGKESHKYIYVNKMAAEYITALDAHCYGTANTKRQFLKQDINRQLQKAFVAFRLKIPQVNNVATGNWGCGAFRGDLRLKFMIQWIACSLAKKQMIYCPFGEGAVLYDKAIIQKVSKQTIGKNYADLIKASELVADEYDKNIYSRLL